MKREPMVVLPSRKPEFWAAVERERSAAARAEKRQSKPDDYEALGGDPKLHRALHEQANGTPGAARMVRALKTAKKASQPAPEPAKKKGGKK